MRKEDLRQLGTAKVRCLSMPHRMKCKLFVEHLNIRLHRLYISCNHPPNHAPRHCACRRPRRVGRIVSPGLKLSAPRPWLDLRRCRLHARCRVVWQHPTKGIHAAPGRVMESPSLLLWDAAFPRFQVLLLRHLLALYRGVRVIHKFVQLS